MFRLGAVLLLLGVALAGCGSATSPEAVAEVYRANPAAFDSLRAMILVDARGREHLTIRPDLVVADSVSHRGITAAEREGPLLGMTPDRLRRYLSLLTEAGARGITAYDFDQDSAFSVEVWIASSGISVSGCTADLVYGREPYENSGGDFYWSVVVGNDWFAEASCT